MLTNKRLTHLQGELLHEASRRHKTTRSILSLFIVIAFLGTFFRPVEVVQAANFTVKEGNDFATLVLRDPWDMNAYSDVSQYINQSGQSITLNNPSVSNGVFNATTATNDSNFFPLFPGYLTAMEIGKVGANYPIRSSSYNCLYMAMNVPASAFEVFWFADSRLNGGIWGMYQQTKNMVSGWNLYKVDLSSSYTTGNRQWKDGATWQGLRIDPTVTPGANIAVDWVRLTDCAAVNVTFSGLPVGTLNPILSRDGRDIKLPAIPVSNGSADLDVQGVEPGTYNYVLKNTGGSTVQSGQITINAAPIVNFAKPSPTGGAGYSGADWSMQTSASVSAITCTSYNFSGGLLNLSTLDKASTSPNCVSGGVNDPIIRLNTPLPINPNTYRYLTFRMNTDGAWQNVPHGMVARLVWKTQGTGGSNTFCDQVSQDIPFDVGWNTYTVDLWDSFEGSSEQNAGLCPGLRSWLASGNILELRFDPNENELGRTLNQNIDFIYLAEEEKVPRGSDYLFELTLNKTLGQLQSYSFYYTTDRNVPIQNSANVSLFAPAPPQSPPGPYRLYLPAVINGASGMQGNGTLFVWKTNLVTAGTYYLCMKANDGLNEAVYCSETPVTVY
ncbi:MAG: hypothetical protein JW987_13970 [Anaerolineaceae bacterium]|nr:hypothetical protein [Anaerolineaceae bacterium]